MANRIEKKPNESSLVEEKSNILDDVDDLKPKVESIVLNIKMEVAKNFIPTMEKIKDEFCFEDYGKLVLHALRKWIQDDLIYDGSFLNKVKNKTDIQNEFLCNVIVKFHSEIKDNKVLYLFNLEKLVNTLQKKIQKLKRNSAIIGVQEFYESEQGALEMDKKFPPQIIKGWKKDSLVDIIEDNSKLNTLKQKISEKTITYFNIRSIYHKRTFNEEIITTLNEIGEGNYCHLSDVLF